MDQEIRKPGPDPGTLLRLSEHFLRRRRFADCRNYAHQLDPNFPGVTEILAVADVLLASNRQSSTVILRDWYEVMQLSRYTQDTNLITNRFNHLYAILNPSNNKLPFADEAFDVVCDAWYVLSDPVKKLEFDDLLKKVLDCEQLNSDFGSVFWTACPYCYYLYEYPRVYLEVCVRCPNVKCCKAFTCVEIDRPPVEVLKEGKYLCCGFLQVGFGNGCWNPFAPLSKQKVDQKVNGGDGNDKFIEISDDDDDGDDGIGGEGVYEGAGVVKMEVDMQTKKVDVGRKKSLAKNVKKVTGAGNRVRKQGIVHTGNTDGCEYF